MKSFDDDDDDGDAWKMLRDRGNAHVDTAEGISDNWNWNVCIYEFIHIYEGLRVVKTINLFVTWNKN